MGRIQEYHQPISTPRIISQTYCDHGCPLRSPPPLRDYACLLRRFGCRSLEDQEHAERRQEAQALGGPVGQTDDGPRPSPYRIPAWTDRPGLGSGWFRVHQWLEGREARLVKTKLPQLHTETDTTAHCARSCFSFHLFLLA